MSSAQLLFRITNQSLRRLDNYIGTEGSMNFLHASFSIDDDTNIPNPILAVYARYENEIYQVPKNIDTGLYDIPSTVIQYPGFFVSCVILSGDDSGIQRTTEEVNIQIKGNGNILKRYVKSSDEYSTEFITRLYAQHVKNCENIKTMNSNIVEMQKSLESLHDSLELLGNITQKAFMDLGEALKSITIDEPSVPEPVEPVNPDDITDSIEDEKPDDSGNTDEPSGDKEPEKNPDEGGSSSGTEGDNTGSTEGAKDSETDTPKDDNTGTGSDTPDVLNPDKDKESTEDGTDVTNPSEGSPDIEIGNTESGTDDSSKDNTDKTADSSSTEVSNESDGDVL